MTLDKKIQDIIPQKLRKELKECQKTGMYSETYEGITFCLYKGYLHCPYRIKRPDKKGAGWFCKRPTNEKEK